MAQGRVDRLRTGVAYHGNRLLRHVEEDMRDAIDHGFNLIVHMLSHNDWDRHRTVMKEIVGITHGLGLEAWLDNWGLGGRRETSPTSLPTTPAATRCTTTGAWTRCAPA